MYTRYFALRVLDERVAGRVLEPFLARLDDSWMSPFTERLIAEFVQKRRVRGDAELDPDALAHHDRELSDWLVGVLRRGHSDDLADRIESAREARVDLEFLRSFGRVWTAGDVPDAIIQDDTLRRRVAEIERALRQSPPRSILLVGEAGVGKTTAIQALAEKLLSEDWILFQAGAVELLAGSGFRRWTFSAKRSGRV